MSPGSALLPATAICIWNLFLNQETKIRIDLLLTAPRFDERGVFTWSKDMDGLVENSSDLGIFMLNQDGVSIVTNIRSSLREKEAEILNAQLDLAEKCGFSVETVRTADA